ncbi:MAG: YopX family protein [Smithella sp.]
MKEIKFRGMSLSGEWFCGLLSHSNGRNMMQPVTGYYISNSAGQPWAYAVRPETIGQFIGRRDKNGKEIYEGDVCRFSVPMSLYIGKSENNRFIGEIKWDDSELGYYLLSNNGHHPYVRLWIAMDIEVIGNIYENPELLEATG